MTETVVSVPDPGDGGDDHAERVAEWVERLIHDTSSSLFRFRMANGNLTVAANDAMRRSARTRRRIAARDLDRLVRDYVARHPLGD